MNKKIKPDYQANSIVNLMSAICRACDADISPYTPHCKLSIEELKDAKNIILILVDGLGYEYLSRNGEGSTLKKFLSGSMTSVFPTTTASAITTFATATAPMQHAITGWFMHLKEIGCVTAVLPFTPRATMQSFATERFNIADVLKINPLFTHLQRLSYMVNQKRIVDSEYSVLTTVGAERVEYYGLSDFFAQIINLAKINDAKKYIYGYWADFDALCHVHGIDSDIVKQHFMELDEEFAELIAFLQGTDSIVIVTADHGLIDANTQSIVNLEDHPELANMLTLPLCGEPRVAYCYVKPHQTSTFESYITNNLENQCSLHRSEDLIAADYFGLGIPNPRLQERIGDYTLIMNQNYVIKDCLTGERPFTQIGVHGGLSQWELIVPLVVITC